MQYRKLVKTFCGTEMKKSLNKCDRYYCPACGERQELWQYWIGQGRQRAFPCADCNNTFSLRELDKCWSKGNEKIAEKMRALRLPYLSPKRYAIYRRSVVAEWQMDKWKILLVL